MEKYAKVTYRHYAIKELINEHVIESQQQLIDLLKEDYQIETNQSIISRDLADLGVVKQNYKGKIVYELPDITATKEILKLGVESVVHNEMMIVVNTVRGLAPFIGDYLDEQKNLNILRTLAGENVVYVLPVSMKNIEASFHAVRDALFCKEDQPQTEAAQESVQEPKKKTRKGKS